MKLLLPKSLHYLLIPCLLAVCPGILVAQEAQPAPLVAGDSKADSDPGDPAASDPDHDQQMPRTLVAVLTPTEGNEARGHVTFEAMKDDQVRVTARVSGLKSDAKHAIHVHEFGDLSAPDGSSAGGHFNPAGTDHGLPDSEVKHPGDFGNLRADADGNANLVLTVKGLSLTEGENAIIGRAVIVHAGEDKGTQPSGDAGDRIAHGVIAVANPGTVRDRVAAKGAAAPSDAVSSSSQHTGTARPVTRTSEPTPAEELGEVAEEIGRGAEKAARVTAKAVERGVEEAGQALRKAGKTIEKAVE